MGDTDDLLKKFYISMEATSATDVVVQVGNMCLPARIIAKEDEMFTVTIKYSKLALEHDLISVTMSLPPSRVEFGNTWDSFREVKYLKAAQNPVHTSNVSASSELSSHSSEWHDSVEGFRSGEI